MDKIKQLLINLTPLFVFKLRTYIRERKPIVEDISNFKDHFQFELPEESVILANGPSLNYFTENHLEFIEGKSVFCINSFGKSEHFCQIKPTFYVFSDPVFWNKNCSKRIIEQVMIIVDRIKNNVTWKMYILLPNNARLWNWFLDLPSSNSNISLVYFNMDGTSDCSVKRFDKYKANKAMPPAQTVLVASIFLSLNLGFKVQYLVGADLSLHEGITVNDKNVVCNKGIHFYKDETDYVPFWKNAENTETFKMYEALSAFSTMFRGFSELREYSDFLNVKILNASHKTYIDAFERYKI